MCAGIHGEAGRPHLGENDEVTRSIKGVNLPADGFGIGGRVFPNKLGLQRGDTQEGGAVFIRWRC